jgi:hypothetical protein
MDPMKLPKLHVTAVGRKRGTFQASLHDFFWNFNCWIEFSIRSAVFYYGLKLIAVHKEEFSAKISLLKVFLCFR